MSGTILSASVRSASFLMNKSKPSNNDNDDGVESTAITPPTPSSPKNNGTTCEDIGNRVDETISTFFHRIGHKVSTSPKLTITLTLLLSILCAGGMAKLNTENRPEKLWVPQNTVAEEESDQFLELFPPNARFESVIVTSSDNGNNNNNNDENVLTKENLIEVMKLHQSISTTNSTYNDQNYSFIDSTFGAGDGLCTIAGGACPTFELEPICLCLVLSPLQVWNYNLDRLVEDEDYMATLNTYADNPKDYESVFGNAQFDTNGVLIGATAISVSYFVKDQSYVENGNSVDPINEEWEKSVFLKSVEDAQLQQQQESGGLNFAYLSSRSFADEFGDDITGDLVFVQVSYIIAFLFVGATLGSRLSCGKGSRWAMSLSAIFLVALSTVAGFGVASLCGLLYGPVHSVLPFVLLGIGVDDAFVIANAFDREREGIARESESDASLIQRGARALARAGASITVTSLTDLVAFAISASSSLPALASFCAFASINIFFLWILSATFFVACMVIDEKRQRDNRRDCLCCFTRRQDEKEDVGSEEGFISKYFRNYQAPAILSKGGKLFTLILFSGLFAFGVYGTIKLPVEDSSRNFIPVDSYIKDYSEASDEYFPSSGETLYITFENGPDIYESREALADLKTRLSGLSMEPPYLAEPNDSNYRNVMAGLKEYLASDAASIGVEIGDDGWPTNYEDFVATVRSYAQFMSPGAPYAQDVVLSEEGSDVEALRIKTEYVRLTKTYRGEVLDDASKQIAAMDETRNMIDSWTDLPSAFPYSAKFIDIEGFKQINTELYRNVGLAILAVGIIVLITVANIVTSLLITVNVAFCIIEILGAMFALGLVIDSVSVINIVLAVGLSIDYSAHIGHCFMVKGGNDNDARATEALADLGASVLNGALSTFLAVAVLLFSKSYVFRTLSIQFALTVGLGVFHGLVLLPVLLALFGPKPFASAEPIKKSLEDDEPVEVEKKKPIDVEQEPVVCGETGCEVLANAENGVGEDAFEENTA